MPRRRYGTRRRADALSFEAIMELMLGPHSEAGLEHFEADNEAEDAYFAHRDELAELFGGELTKLWAFQRYELPKLEMGREEIRAQRKSERGGADDEEEDHTG